jgi:hypothetical protein
MEDFARLSLPGLRATFRRPLWLAERVTQSAAKNRVAKLSSLHEAGYFTGD